MLKRNKSGEPIEVYGLPIHEFANMVPMASEAEQETLKRSIEEHGQEFPILLYRGKIIDGRCRVKACGDLGIPIADIKKEELAHSLSLKEVWIITKKCNTRRNLTPTQKALVAAKEYRMGVKGLTQDIVRESWGIGKTPMTDAVWLLKNNSGIALLLLDGGVVELAPNEYSKSIQKVTQHFRTLYSSKAPNSYTRKYVTGNIKQALPDPAERAWFDIVAADIELYGRKSKDPAYLELANNVESMLITLAPNNVHFKP